MKKITAFVLILVSFSAIASAQGKKRISPFTGDLNGDGFTDLVISDGTNYRDAWGTIKVFFGNATGIDTLAGWVYKCKMDNFLESDKYTTIVSDVNGDGIDDLCTLLSNLSKEKSGRSHQDIFVFYGSKENFGSNPVILKVEADNKDKYSIRSYIAFDYNGDGITDILAESSKRNYDLSATGYNDDDKKLILFRGTGTGISTSFEVIRNINDIYFKDAGDINNDGLGDLRIAEPDKSNVIWTQYVSNKNGQPVAKPFTSYKLPGLLSSNRVYSSTAWDFNGDHFDDALIMYEDAPPALNPRKDSGRYTIDFYAGSSDGLQSNPSYTWKYVTTYDTALNITPCADVNNDGYGDFIVKKFQPYSKVPGLIANILWGGKDGFRWDESSDFNTLFHAAYLVTEGLSYVVALGDINNDGCCDLLLGAETIAYGNKDGTFKTVQLKFLD